MPPIDVRLPRPLRFAIPSGWIALLLTLLALVAGSPIALGDTEVRATVDRTTVSLEETLTLTLSADSMLFSGEPDIAALQEDFHILNRQQSSRTNIVNGDISSSRQWEYTLAPKREGQITIPAIPMGKKSTRPITVTVSAAPQRQRSGNQQVWLEADITPRRSYVQAQLEYTVKLFSSVNFLDASLDAPTIDNAVVEPIGENRYRQQIDGRYFQVIERRYAIFPQRSGELEIPALTLQARVESYRPSLLDPGRLLIKRSPPLTVKIDPPPSQFSGSLWLPAANLDIVETWSGDVDSLEAGQSITRSIHIRADGLLAAQLPALPATVLDGARLYPDQAKLSNDVNDTGVSALRTESLAIIPGKAGTYTLPEIRIPWWNTRTNSPEVAILPARELKVSGGTAAAPTPTFAQSAPNAATESNTAPLGEPAPAHSHRLFWLAIGALALFNTALLIALLRRRPAALTAAPAQKSNDEKTHFDALTKLCKNKASAQALRAAINSWARSHPHLPNNLDALGREYEELRPFIDGMNLQLYGEGSGDIDHSALLDTLRQCRKGASEEKKPGTALPALYP